MSNASVSTHEVRVGARSVHSGTRRMVPLVALTSMSVVSTMEVVIRSASATTSQGRVDAANVPKATQEQAPLAALTTTSVKRKMEVVSRR